jgi:cell division protease FtsH
LSFQEEAFAPPTVAYSKFKHQLANDNVESVFSTGSTIQGTLREAAQLPDKGDATYKTFTTQTGGLREASSS